MANKKNDNVNKLDKKTLAEWDELYEYVKFKILEYSPEMNLSKFIVLRLKGLAEGRFLSNKKIKPLANYDFKTILLTFKAYKFEIMNGLANNRTKFKDEQHKFNYIMVIIESNINTIVLRLENAKKAKQKAEMVSIDHIFTEGAEYKTKTKETNKNLKDLW